jgi:signal transduction histidine kinase
MLVQRLDRALDNLLAELEGERHQAEVEPVRAFLEQVVRRTEAPPSTVYETLLKMRAGEEEVVPFETAKLLDDPNAAKTALRSIRRLQQALMAGALSYVSAPGDATLEVERMFEMLAQAEAELVDDWLVAEVFHDFRSPLTSVFFLSDALYAGLSGALSDTQKQQIGLIFAASLSLLTLVDNVLSSRNLDAGRLKAEKVPLSVGALAEEVERITRPLAVQNGLTLRFELDCRDARVGDPDVLRRVLLNLVTNAINYTEEGGAIVRFQESEADIVLLVEDTGPGIGDQQLEDLFKTFRASAEGGRRGERRFSGSGLGLSLCHRLATLVEGDIWVESELGHGSCFGVRLPFPPL